MGVLNDPEKNSTVTNSGGLVVRGGKAVSAVILDGGTAATGATMELNDSDDNSGTDLIKLRAAQYDSKVITFVKPIVFTNGVYLDINPSGGAAYATVCYD